MSNVLMKKATNTFERGSYFSRLQQRINLPANFSTPITRWKKLQGQLRIALEYPGTRNGKVALQRLSQDLNVHMLKRVAK